MQETDYLSCTESEQVFTVSARQSPHYLIQYLAAAALGLTIYIAFGAVLGEANAAEANCQQHGKISRKWILLIQQATESIL